VSLLTASSRVRANIPTSLVTCTVLNKGYSHLIKGRPTNAEITRKMVEVYGTSARYAPTVTLKNGETRRVMINEFTKVGNDHLEFVGMIANGNDFVRVTGSFTGEAGGHIVIAD